MFFGKTNIIILRSSGRFERTLGSRLEGYLRSTSQNGDSNLMPEGAHAIRVSDVIKIGGGLSNDIYSLLLTYVNGGLTQYRSLIVKTYRENVAVDPLMKAHIHDEEIERCVNEFQILRSLGHVDFPAPQAFLCERDSRFLGYPFVIMCKEEVVKKNTTELVDRFAATLARLHNLKVSDLGIDFLRPPKDQYAFARHWPVYFKRLLNLETKHNKRLKKDFDSAIDWLDSNVSNNYCPQYCVIHGDYHPGNVSVTNDSRLIVTDWETVDIGDPAYDVGYAYHLLKFFSNPKNPNLAAKTAERFVSEYMRNFKGDIRRRLEFYKMVGILARSIYCSSGLSNPIYAYRNRRRKVLPTFPFLSGFFILLGFPFLRWSFVARKLGAEGDAYWLKYFQSFLEATLK